MIALLNAYIYHILLVCDLIYILCYISLVWIELKG